MRRNKKWIAMLATVLASGMLVGCTQEIKVKHIVDGPVEQPPEISISNPSLGMSSEYSSILQAGGYSWCYHDGSDTVNVVADAVHPLQAAEMDTTEALLVQDGSLYNINSQPIAPDEITAVVWDAEDIGNVEAEPEEINVEKLEMTTTNIFTVELQQDKVYEFKVVWKGKNLEENGFYGIAYYTLVTKGKN